LRRSVSRSVSIIGTLVAATTLSSLAAAPVFAARGAAPARFSAGAQGVGDPYFPQEGNGGYDVAHYDLKLAYDPATHHLGGSNTLIAVAKKGLSRFDLDLSGYRVSSVTVNGTAAAFRRDGQELVITPAQGIPRGTTFRTVVSYAGTPKTIKGSPVVFGAPYGWIYTKDGAFVGCEPNAARTWYPSNDHPSDKATFRFTVSVPKSRKVVANGDYVGHHVNGDTDTFVWNQPKPMATYLATLGIGRWTFHRTTTARGIPSFTAVDPSLEAQARDQHTVALSGRVTDYWQKRFGRFPFTSTGAIVDNVPSIGFSLETQNRPIYGFVPDPGTVSHELAHEWFGDSVSVRDWRHIWLNEGFATFGSWLWSEHTDGDSTLSQAREVFRGIRAGDPFWDLSIADPKRNTMFSQSVYLRGAMTLAALRHRIGDQDFFTLLRTWVRDHEYGNVTTRQFRTLAERVSGEQLDGFFETWLWKHRKPGRL